MTGRTPPPSRESHEVTWTIFTNLSLREELQELTVKHSQFDARSSQGRFGGLTHPLGKTGPETNWQ